MKKTEAGIAACNYKKKYILIQKCAESKKAIMKWKQRWQPGNGYIKNYGDMLMENFNNGNLGEFSAESQRNMEKATQIHPNCHY